MSGRCCAISAATARAVAVPVPQSENSAIRSAGRGAVSTKSPSEPYRTYGSGGGDPSAASVAAYATRILAHSGSHAEKCIRSSACWRSSAVPLTRARNNRKPSWAQVTEGTGRVPGGA